MLSNHVRSELESMVGRDEEILWQGKPDKQCYILEEIFNPFLPFALIWGLIDLFFIIAITTSSPSSNSGAPFPLLLFFLLHLAPVWIYLGGVFFVHKRYQNTEYMVTTKGVYYSSGLFSYVCNMKPFTELARVNIQRGIIDQMLGVGDVVLTSNNAADFSMSNVRASGRPLSIGITIADIRDYKKVFEIIKKLQEDIYTDTMYPNDLRPKENHGYKTKYTGLD